MNSTLQYYDNNAEIFSEATVNVDFSDTQKRFLNKLSSNAKILDLGCGAGRDAKYFIEKGYEVDAVDGSAELCKIASKHTGISVKQMLFQDLSDIEKYDGIWACASILHLTKEELKDVITRISKALRPHGIFYTSFKYGAFEGERNGRYFTDFTEESFREFIGDNRLLSVQEIWITNDVRPDRGNEKWLNLILSK